MPAPTVTPPPWLELGAHVTLREGHDAGTVYEVTALSTYVRTRGIRVELASQAGEWGVAAPWDLAPADAPEEH